MESARPINIKMPLEVSPRGAFATNDTTLDAVADNLRMLLNTNWGERVNNFYYGANLRSVLFENSEEIEQLARDRISSAVERSLPGVAVVDYAFDHDPAKTDANTFNVKVTFNILNTDLVGQVSVTVK